MPIKTRFSPSPSGHLHLGNIRTAMFNYLKAMQSSGTFLLRLEDSDRSRSSVVFSESLQQDLRWLGLQWQEGPGVEGEHGPYRQSERQAIYANYHELLIAKGLAYPCFCSEQMLKASRQLQRASGKPPRYDGTCRHLSVAERQHKHQAGMASSLRFAVPRQASIVFHDQVHGEQCIDAASLGDFIIRRADGSSPFLFSNAIDDALMQITHVIRGDDHLANTPRQLLLLRALDLPEPLYAHIALIVTSDKTPLSKRLGSLSVATLRQQGYLPQALRNYLARLGHYYRDENLLSMAELAEKFSMKNLSKSAAHFDAQQLHYWQQQALAAASVEELLTWLQANEVELPLADAKPFLAAIQPNIVFPADVLSWYRCFYQESIVYDEDTMAQLRLTPVSYWQQLLAALADYQDDAKPVIAKLKAATPLKGKALYQPLRLALTASSKGPDLASIFRLLGKEKLIKRIRGLMQQLTLNCR